MTVRIPIQADGGQVAKAFTDIRKAMERAGQAGRELSKIDLSHPELKEQAEDIRKVIGHYEELKRVWRQLDARTKATGQSGAAPWDLDLGRMYPTSGQAARARRLASACCLARRGAPDCRQVAAVVAAVAVASRASRASASPAGSAVSAAC